MGSDSGDGGHGDLYGTGSVRPNDTGDPEPVSEDLACHMLHINLPQLVLLVETWKLNPIDREHTPWEFTTHELNRYKMAAIDDQYDLVNAPHPTDGEESADTVVDAVVPVPAGVAMHLQDQKEPVEPPPKRAKQLAVAITVLALGFIFLYCISRGWFS